MVLENEKVRSEKLYCVGYLKNLGKYILSQTIPASAWYNRYYEITKEQYDSFGSESPSAVMRNFKSFFICINYPFILNLST